MRGRSGALVETLEKWCKRKREVLREDRGKKKAGKEGGEGWPFKISKKVQKSPVKETEGEGEEEGLILI